VNLFGIGNLEIVIVLIIALLVLGPARMVDVARQTGRWWREAQQLLRGMADAATVKLDETPSLNAPPRDPVDPPEDAVAREPDPQPEQDPDVEPGIEPVDASSTPVEENDERANG
jgi:Sec-independent protein translocase protein TatA